jgi:hypothetical protein
MEAAARPLPREERTPPVIKMYFVLIQQPLSLYQTILNYEF